MVGALLRPKLFNPNCSLRTREGSRDEQRAYFAERGFEVNIYGELTLRKSDTEALTIRQADRGTWYAYYRCRAGQGYLCRGKDPIALFAHCEVTGYELDDFRLGWDNCFAVGYRP